MRKLILTCVIALAFVPWAGAHLMDTPGCTELQQMETKARTDIAAGRASHSNWLEFRRGSVPPEQMKIWELEAKLRGIPTDKWIAHLQEWDQEWVDNYDNMIAVINLGRRECG